VVGVMTGLILAAVATPNLLRSRSAADEARRSVHRAYGGSDELKGAYQSAAALPKVTVAGYVLPGRVEAGEGEFGGTGDRKVIRTASLDLLVAKPSETVAELQWLVEKLGGYIESEQLDGGDQAKNGTVRIWVPSDRVGETILAIRKLAKRVDSEQVTASDVTRQVVDMNATLVNYRAEEAQYLEIMKRTGSIKDVLAVSERLADVRGRIERLQSELQYLSHQTEMAAISVSMHVEPVAYVPGLHWRPLEQARLSVIGGLDAIADYANAMFALLCYLPVVAFWLVTIVGSAVVIFRILRWAYRRVVSVPTAATPATGNSSV
jgi:hypothetical protein